MNKERIVPSSTKFSQKCKKSKTKKLRITNKGRYMNYFSEKISLLVSLNQLFMRILFYSFEISNSTTFAKCLNADGEENSENSTHLNESL